MTLPDPPPTPFNAKCSGPVQGLRKGHCGRPRMCLGMNGKDAVWLCIECDMGAPSGTLQTPTYVRPGPPRLVRYIRTGDSQ